LEVVRREFGMKKSDTLLLGHAKEGLGTDDRMSFTLGPFPGTGAFGVLSRAADGAIGVSVSCCR
jgi:hypothetical protein